MKKYEYKIIGGSVNFTPSEDEEILTGAGQEGWELVSWVEGKVKGQGFGVKRIYYVMKKEIEE